MVEAQRSRLFQVHPSVWQGGFTVTQSDSPSEEKTEETAAQEHQSDEKIMEGIHRACTPLLSPQMRLHIAS